MRTLTINGEEYEYIYTNPKGHFIWDWGEYCHIEPDTEEVYEDINGDAYILYKNKDGEVLGQFKNTD